MPGFVDRAGPAPNVHLSLPNRPENVLLVRQVLTGVAEALDLDAGELYEINVAVTEACNNVVLHAYRGDEGPLEVDVHIRPAALEVVVRDRGVGIRPRISAAEEATGTGLSVIQALCQDVALATGQDSGTDVRMTFDALRTSALYPPSSEVPELPKIGEVGPNAAIEITLSPVVLARTILPRLMSVFAARARFTTDRLVDGQLMADELAAYVQRSTVGGHLSVGISVQPRDLELRLAPLQAGQANRLLAGASIDGVGPVIGKLSTQHSVSTLASGTHEMLSLRMVQAP